MKYFLALFLSPFRAVGALLTWKQEIKHKDDLKFIAKSEQLIDEVRFGKTTKDKLKALDELSNLIERDLD